MTESTTLAELAERFGSPLFVYDGEVLRDQFRGLRERLHPAMEIFFSLKSNPNVSICALLRSAGARAEVSSIAELLTALRAGVPSEDIVFLGPGKSDTELAACLEHRVHAVIAESFSELAALDRLAGERGVTAPVVLRVNPGFSVKGGGLTMGGKARQFGIDEQQVLDGAETLRGYRNLRVFGIQAYMGTRILKEEVVVDNARRIFDLAERLAGEVGFPLEFVDVGGGLGVAYFEGERDPDVDRMCAELNPIVEDFHRKHPQARLVMELGRYLTATCGTYVARVVHTKTSFGQNFAVLDGGTNHHMAAVGIGSAIHRNFPVRLVSRPDAIPDGEWTLTGPLCTPNDTLVKKVALPELRTGDVIAVERSGAYGPTASPVLFLSHGYPAEVLVHGGTAHVIRHRDRPEELLDRQVLAVPVP